jgi:hypothetical protein
METQPEVANSIKMLSVSGGWRDTMIAVRARP